MYPVNRTPRRKSSPGGTGTMIHEARMLQYRESLVKEGIPITRIPTQQEIREHIMALGLLHFVVPRWFFDSSAWESDDEVEAVEVQREVEEITEKLPAKRYNRVLRHARHTFFNVYRRLFSVVFVLNLIGAIILATTHRHWTSSPPLSDMATAASANVMVAILIRTDYVINFLYKTCWALTPLSAPLRIRRMLGKLYEFGGVHSGAGVCSALWFLLFTAFLSKEFGTGKMTGPPILVITYILLAILWTIIITAYPLLRTHLHNSFEIIHRFGGWLALALFWAEIVFFAYPQQKVNTNPSQVPTMSHASSPGRVLVTLPAFYFLIVSTFVTILPWLRLHKLYVTPEHYNGHAIRLHFSEPLGNFVGLRLSSNPLLEWHSFAAIPHREGETGGSLLISTAGDWTRQTIENPKPYYWVKGIPLIGVLGMAQLFKRCIIVTTGSGIGPCLAVMQDIPQTSVRVIWSTPSPKIWYSQGVIDSVYAVDPKALVIDTRELGKRPDLVAMTYGLYKKHDAEAIFVISNAKLTKKIVYGLESRGVPTFGPIWDS